MKNDKKKDSKITLREHVFDGIEEYDQKLPNWWLFTLYITIVWFVIAWFVYYQTPLRTLTDHEKVDARIAEIEAMKKAELEKMLATLNDDTLQQMSTDPNHTGAGKAIFEAKCAACHGLALDAKLNGIQLPGLPLNDTEWKYGGNPLAIMKTVTEGSPDITKGMIAWKTQLGPTDIAQVVAYILSRQPAS